MSSLKLMESTALVALIGSIGKSGVSLQNDIQTAAIQAIGYSIEHRDVSFGQRLLEAMTKSTRKDALVAYLEKHGQFAWSKVDKKLVFFEVKDIQFDLAVLEKAKWFDAKKEPEISSIYDVQAAVDKLVKSAEQAVKAGKQIQNEALLSMLVEASAKYNSRLVLGEAADHAVGENVSVESAE